MDGAPAPPPAAGSPTVRTSAKPRKRRASLTGANPIVFSGHGKLTEALLSQQPASNAAAPAPAAGAHADISAVLDGGAQSSGDGHVDVRTGPEPPSVPPARPFRLPSDVTPALLGGQLHLPARSEIPFREDGLGTMLGVFTPVSCTIFGVVVFLRLGFVVGQAGFYGALSIIGCGFLISFLTVLSLSALITNGLVETGALYVAVRNSIGPELGGAIGVVFYMAYCVGGAFYCMGFAETTHAHAGFRSDVNVFPWNPPGSWINTIIASMANFSCLIICTLGVSVSVKVSAFILGVIYLCIVTACICLMASTKDDVDGYTAFSMETLANNTQPAFTEDYSLVSVFAVFFPGFTGCLAGANLSGDLQDANESIAKGTILALISAFVVYIAVIFTLATTVQRDTLQDNLLIMDTISTNTLGGLPVVYIGITFCTLSSSLSYMLGGPRVLQALAHDEVFGPLKWFSHTTANGEPLRALVLTWFFMQLIIMLGDIDLMAPMMTAFFCLTFCVINLTCFLLEIAVDDFEPDFQLHSKYTSFVGLVLSFGAAASCTAWPISLGITTCIVLLLWWRRQHLVNILRGKNAAEGHTSIDGEQTGGDNGADGARRSVGWQKARSALGKKSQRNTLSNVLLGSEGTSLENAELKLRVERAAAYVRDALDGRFAGAQWVETEGSIVTLKLLFHRLKVLRLTVMCIFLSISFFERPSWCPPATCGDPNVVLLSGVWQAPQVATVVVEGSCLVFFVLEMWVKHKYRGSDVFWRNRWHLVQIAIMIAEVSGFFIQILTPDTIRLTLMNPLMRPLLFVAMSRRVRGAWINLVKIIPSILEVFSLVTLTIFVFAIVGMLLFQGSEEGSTYFPDIWTSSMSLLILLTTANFPDIMMPAYREHRGYFFYFFVFLLIAYYFGTNLILATVYNSYRRQFEEKAAEYRRRTQEALTVAFHLLDVHNCNQIDIELCVMLLKELERPAFAVFDYETSRVEIQNTKQMVADLQAAHRAAGMTGISQDYFSRLVASMQLNKKKNRKWGKFKDKLKPKGTTSPTNTVAEGGSLPSSHAGSGSSLPPALVQLVTHEWFEYAVDFIVLANSLVLAKQADTVARCSAAEQAGSAAQIWEGEGACGSELQIWDIIEPMFTVAYCCEMLVKLLVYGVNGYMSSETNCFDGVITISCLVGEFVRVFAHTGRHATRLILLVRFARVGRLLATIKRFNVIFATFLQLLPSFTTLFLMISALFYVYAAIGVDVFGGKVRVDHPLLQPNSTDPDGAAFGQAGYYANNFNDFASALVTLFELMVVNNWFVIMNGVTVVSHKYAPLYFISFWMITVMVVMNLVVAFVLEAFFEKTSENDTKAALALQEVGRDSARNSRASGVAALDELLGQETSPSSPFSFGF